MNGWIVRSLPGSSSLSFDGRDATGRRLGSGVYWVNVIGIGEFDPIQVVRLR